MTIKEGNKMTIREWVIKKFLNIGLLKEGNTKFKIKGDFGEIELIDLITKIIEEEKISGIC